MCGFFLLFIFTAKTKSGFFILPRGDETCVSCVCACIHKSCLCGGIELETRAHLEKEVCFPRDGSDRFSRIIRLHKGRIPAPHCARALSMRSSLVSAGANDPLTSTNDPPKHAHISVYLYSVNEDVREITIPLSISRSMRIGPFCLFDRADVFLGPLRLCCVWGVQINFCT